jgi:regulator of cell morphogenesis and NO signaling
MFGETEAKMAAVSLEATVGRLVTENPARARVFERRGIDYCCGGKVSLKAACEAKGLDPGAALAEIALCDDLFRGETQTNWEAATVSELIDDIQTTHHRYLKEELPRLSFLTEKVARAHGARHPELEIVHETFDAFRSELESHMMKEELILFPLCRQLEAAESAPSFHCGSVGNPIRVMEHEHDSAGAALAKFHELTGGYAPPQGACNTYRAMLDGLKTLEEDMHLHVHKENSILFPKALALEESLTATA